MGIKVNREIKFRAKDRDRKWIYFNAFGVGTFTFDLETLGQYTGLKDKNGKEIYEGDIVYPCFYGDKQVVQWNVDDAGWYPFSQPAYGGHDAEAETSEYIEVIGNIHDDNIYVDQELLEHSKDE